MMAQLDLAQLERTAFEQRTLTAYATQLDLAQLERIDLDQLERDQLERIGLDQLERIALEKLPVSQLSGKELEKPSKISELLSLQRKELEKMTAKSLAKIELERTALHKSFLSLLQISLTEDKLAACNRWFASQPDKGQTALASRGAAWIFQFLGEELENHLAFPGIQQKAFSFRGSQPVIFHKAQGKNFNKLEFSRAFHLLVHLDG